MNKRSNRNVSLFLGVLLLAALSACSSDQFFGVGIKGNVAVIPALSLSGSPALVIGGCSEAFTITLKDPAGQDLTVSLSGNGSGNFFSDAGCTESVTSVRIPKGESALTFHYMGDVVESVNLTVTAPGFEPQVLVVEVGPGPAKKLAFEGPASVLTGACTGYSIAAQDDFGNESALREAASVTLGTSGNGGFYRDAACSLPAATVSIPIGQGSVAFFFKGAVPGPQTLTGASAGLTSASLNATVAPGPAVKLLLSGTRLLTAGVCAPYIVTLADTVGNAAPAPAALSIDLSGASTRSGFFTDASCASPTITVALTAGQSLRTVYFRNTLPGNVTLGVSKSGLQSGSIDVTVQPAAPTELTLTGSQAITAGACGAYTLSLKDTFSNPASFVSGVSVGLSGAGLGAFFSDAACVTTVTSVTIPAGTQSKPIYFKDTTAQSVTLRAVAGTLPAATLGVTVGAGIASQLAIGGPTPLSAGACGGPFTVTTSDATGNPSPLPTSQSIALSGAGTAGAFHSNSACSASITSVVVSAGSSTASYYFKGSAAQALQFSASATGLTAAIKAVTVQPAAASQLLLSGPANVIAAACSSAFTVRSTDGLGNVSPVAAATTVSLSGGTFFSDAACTTSAASVSIATGASAASFHLKSSSVQPLVLGAAATGLTSGAMNVSVGPGLPNRLTVSGPSPITQGDCSPAFTVQTKDAGGNLSPVTSLTTINLSVPGTSTGTFFSNSACTTAVTSVAVAAGANQASFHYKDTATGTATVTAAAGGFTDGTKAVTVQPRPANQLGLSGPASVTAGACGGPFTVQSLDDKGTPVNVAAATTVNLAGAGSGGFFSDAACATSATSVVLAAGTSSKNFFLKGSTVQSLSLNASATGLAPATKPVSIVAGAAAKLALTGPASLTAGICSTAYTIATQDASTNAAVVGAATVVTLAGAGTGAFYADSGCLTPTTTVTLPAATGTKTLFFKGVVAQDLTLSASATGLTGASLGISVLAGPAAALGLTGPSTVAAGSCASGFTVTSRDSQGNAAKPAADIAVALSGAGSGAFYGDAACAAPPITSLTLTGGVPAKSFFFKGVNPENLTLGASSAPLTAGSLAVAVQAGSSGMPQLALTGASSVTVASCNGYTVQSKDVNGNPLNVVTAKTVTLTVAGSGAFFSDAACATPVANVTLAAGTSSKGFFFKDNVVESVTMLAATSGYIDAGLDVAIVPSPAVKLALSGPSPLTAGSCSAAYTVQSQNAGSAPAVVSSNTAVTLSGRGSSQVFSNATCTTPATNLTINAGTSATTFFLKDNAAETLNLSVSASGLTNGLLDVVIQAAAVSQLALTGPTPLTAGVCSTAYTVQSKDSFGNVANVGANTTVSLSGEMAGKFYSNAACTTEITSLAFASGTNAKTFFFKDNTAQTPTLLAFANTWGVGNLAVTVQPAAPAVLFLSGPSTLTAGACSTAYTVQSKDSVGNASNVAANTTVTLSGAMAGKFFSDSACATEVTSIAIASGTSSKTFFFKDNTVQSPTLGVAATGLNPGQFTVVIQPAPASQLVLTGPSPLTAGACSTAYTVQTKDVLGNVTNVPLSTTVTLAGGLAGKFFSDAACTAEITSVALASGTSSKTFFFKDGTVQSPTLTASSNGLTTGQLTVAIQSGAPAQLALTGPTPLTAGVCSTAYTVQSKDSAGNNVNVAASTTVTLSGGLGGKFFSDAACATEVTSIAIASGTGAKTFFFKNDTAESPTLNAAANPLTAGTLAVAVQAAAPAKLVLTGQSPLTAGTCSTAYTVRVRDTFNNNANVAASTTVTLSGALAGKFFSDAACTAEVTSIVIASGTGTKTFFFKDNTVQSPNLNAAATNLTASQLTVAIQPAAPAQLVLTGPSPLTAGVCSTAYTVQSKDSLGNAANVAANTTVTLSGALAGKFFSDATCATEVTSIVIASGTSSKTFFFKDNTVQSPNLTASATGLTAGQLTVAIQPAAAAQLALTGPTPVTAGVCSTAYTVQSKDSFGNVTNVAANTTVTLSGALAGKFFSDATCATEVTSVAIASATSSKTFFFKDSTAQSPSLSAAATGLTAGQLTVMVQPAAPAQLSLSGPSPLTAGVCSTAYNVQARDAFGNNANVAANTTVTLSGALAGKFYSNSTCATEVTSIAIASGTSSQQFFFKDNTAQSPNLSASVTGLTAGQLTVMVQPAAPAQLALSGPSPLTAGVCSTFYNVQARDAFGNNANVAANTTVTLSGALAGKFYSNSTCATEVTSIAIASGTSSQQFFFKDTTAESPALSASATGHTAGQLTVVVQPAAPSQLVLTGPSPLTAGVCSTAYTVRSHDAFGNIANIVAGGTVTLSGGLAGKFFSDAACATEVTSIAIAAGSSSKTFFFKDNSAQSPNLTAAVTGLTSGHFPITVQPAATAKLVVNGFPALTAGACSTAYTVTTQDALGNQTPFAGSLTANLAGAGQGAFYSDSGCTTAVTSISLPNGDFAKAFFFKSTKAESLTLTASSNGLTAGQFALAVGAASATTLALTGPSTPTAGVCTEYTVQSQDAFGNPSVFAVATTVTLAGPNNGAFHGNSTCSSPATSLTIAGGSSTKTFYFKDTKAELGIVSVRAGTLTGQQGVTIQPASPTKLFLVGPATLTAGACSAAYTVQSQDTFSNPANLGADTAVTVFGEGDGKFYSDSACTTIVASVTIASATNAKTFFFKDNKAEALTFGVRATNLVDSQLAVTVQPGAPSKLGFFGVPTPLAGQCTAYAIRSLDTHNNPSNVAADTSITIAGGGAPSPTFVDAGCTVSSGGQLRILSGTSSMPLYFKSNQLGSVTLYANSYGTTTSLSGQVGLAVQVGGPVKLSLTGNLSPTAGGCANYVVTLQDAAGNPVNVTANTVVSLGGGGTGRFSEDNICGNYLGASTVTIAAGTSAKPFSFRGMSSELLTLTVTATNPIGGNAITPGQLRVGVAPSGSPQIYVSGPSTATVGACNAYSIQTYTARGVDAVVGLDSNGRGLFYSDAACTTAVTSVTLLQTAYSQAFYFKDNTPETTTITAVSAGLIGNQLAVTVRAGNPVRLMLSGPSTVNAGACSAAFVLSSQDAFGNRPIDSSDISVSLTGGGSGRFYWDAACQSQLTSMTLYSGAFPAAFYFKNAATESVKIHATATGVAPSQLDVAVGTSTTPKLVFFGPSSPVAGACTAYTVQRQDAAGNPVTNGPGMLANLDSAGKGGFFSDDRCTIAITSILIASGVSQNRFFFKDATVESVTLTGTASGLSTALIAATTLSGMATSISLTGPAGISLETCSAAFTVTSKDAAGNVANVNQNTTISLSSPGDGYFFSDASCSTYAYGVTITAGTSAKTFYYYLDGKAESLVATSSTLGTAHIEVPVVGGAPSQSTMTGPGSLVANVCSPTPYTLSVHDYYGNASNVTSPLTLTLAGLGGGYFYSDAGCVTRITTSTVTIPTGSSSLSLYYLNPYPETVNLYASKAGLAAHSQSVTVRLLAWTWMGGSNLTNQSSTYGNGSPAAANIPGARSNAVTWKDSNGNFWLYGGYGAGYQYPSQTTTATGELNDLWKFNGTNWAFVGGTRWVNQAASHGYQGMPSTSVTPGSRQGAAAWTDSQGNLWLFGGYGWVGSSRGLMNDLWKFDGYYWTWVAGSSSLNANATYGSQGIFAPSNVPGARERAVLWVDDSYNVWLFGGNGRTSSTAAVGQLNDLWKLTGNYWTWMGGSNLPNAFGVYGTKGVANAANQPGARVGAVSWIDDSNHLWLFGGNGRGSSSGSTGYLNDLWKFDGAQWTWMDGSTGANQNESAGVPGARENAFSWTDGAGALWLYGGYGIGANSATGSLGSLWKFAAGAWTKVTGSSTTGNAAVYGTKGTPALTNDPGQRCGAGTWVDASNQLWFFGGDKCPQTGSGNARFNDFWRYTQ